ncbi:MAG: hypothetical protein ACM3X1_03830 [Ignavibacteriales bacterium]
MRFAIVSVMALIFSLPNLLQNFGRLNALAYLSDEMVTVTRMDVTE